jgi:hypothetical protein
MAALHRKHAAASGSLLLPTSGIIGILQGKIGRFTKAPQKHPGRERA